ncbi:uncharacterized protein B0H64DRAFT_393389 [Chaetomium fimeti]|uniref:Zn(2)-C6 fungal-type domain-containing protein n=1 Tax=Chaetomium fimeti TaxID=1854472 RepID=A0AAE0HJZ0_9PEZI|nr:hypothetical protein B0H64DRAFT_393389 [Chaetomium fimeti]
MDGTREYRYHQPAWSLERPPRRLKDSCDMCSASKVRCDRQKPICGRCDKLAYPCFYSPARRVGRPQGRSSRQPKVRRDSAISGVDLENESISLENSAYSVSPIAPISPITRRDSGAVDRRNSASFPSPLDTPPSLGSVTPPVRSCQQRQQQQQRQHQPRQPRPQRQQESERSFDPACVGYSASLSAASSCSSAPSAQNDCESDCVDLAMATQCQLEMASSRLSATLAPVGPWTPEIIQTAEAAMQTAGQAMRRMSTTLICPCSKRLETGMVVSAACLSILDLYGAIVNRFTAQPLCNRSHHSPLMAIMSDTAGTEGGSGALGLSWDDVLSSFSPPDDALLQGGKKKDLMLVQVLGELSKLATVVYQFTNRYWTRAGQAQPGSSEMEILQGLAALLKSRLKAAADETAAKLQTAPSHRVTRQAGTA